MSYVIYLETLEIILIRQLKSYFIQLKRVNMQALQESPKNRPKYEGFLVTLWISPLQFLNCLEIF